MTAESIRPSFDHCYRSVADDSVYQNFERLGFKLNPDPVVHPGRLKCQFLHFLSPAGTSVYLEFLFRDHTLPISSEKPEEPMIHAGFALKVGKDLHRVFGEYENDQPQLKPKFEHRNYKIDSNHSLKLPGWNFLTFENAPVPGVEVWLIEYEPIPGRTEAELEVLRQKYRGMREHPNTARHILGFLWKGIEGKYLENFESVTKSVANNYEMTLEEGAKVHFVHSTDPLFDLFLKKRNPFLAVILGVESLREFIDAVGICDIVEVFGRKAARVKLDDNSWDMIAVETKTGLLNP